MPIGYTRIYQMRYSLWIGADIARRDMDDLESISSEYCIPLSIVVLSSLMTQSIDLEYESELWYEKIYNIVIDNNLPIYIPSEPSLVAEHLPEYHFCENSLFPQSPRATLRTLFFGRSQYGKSEWVAHDGVSGIGAPTPRFAYPSRGESEQGTIFVWCSVLECSDIREFPSWGVPTIGGGVGAPAEGVIKKYW